MSGQSAPLGAVIFESYVGVFVGFMSKPLVDCLMFVPKCLYAIEE